MHPSKPFPLTSSPERGRCIESYLSALLVTWTGLGGHGKMRLAIESTAPLREEFNERVWFVPLADVSDARLILDAVIDALRLPHAPNV